RRLYQGKPHLILILPKGSRSLIPQEWTDLGGLPQDSLVPTKPHTILGSVSDLLHARAVVDALLHRRTSHEGSDEKSVDKENAHLATPAELSRDPHSGNSGVGNAGGETKNLGHRSSGTTGRPSNLPDTEIGGRS
ncbi:MAG: hypothetical protein DMG49_25770, partial [Acidobacteria bacterium]